MMSGFDFKVERMRRDLSQWEVARLSDVPPYRISAFEQGRAQMDEAELRRLEAALQSVEPKR